MAHYAYKNFCYDIDSDTFQKYCDKLEEEYKSNGYEFDADANYNGDYWNVAAAWLTDLLEENKKLRKELEQFKK